jgi:transcriptional regulator with XRE-family HTH domain
MNIDKTKLKIALVTKGWTLAQLASAIDRPSTTLSSWVEGRHPGPADLAEQLGAALGVEPASLLRAPLKP